MSQIKETITISELEAQEPHEPIWVLNTSATSRARRIADVNIGIPKQNGSKIDPLHVPQTWLPICLTDQIPRLQLLAASEFRNAVLNNLLKPITKEYAQQMLEEDGAVEEQRRMDERKQQILDAVASRSIADSGAEVLSVQELQDANANGGLASVYNADGKKEEPTKLTSNFLMFVEATMMDTDIEALNKIRTRGQFNIDEVRHMLVEFRSKEKVVAFLKGKLEKSGHRA